MKKRVFIGKYDPAKRPFPAKAEHSDDPGPIGNSRNQRRQRARLTFVEQRSVAERLGFPVPASALTKEQEQDWIKFWEGKYAER